MLVKLEKQELTNQLSTLSSKWRINEQGHLFAKFNFKDFVTPMAFANKITLVSEEINHHPQLTLSWGYCEVEIWTHDLQSLSLKDFELAKRIEELF